jgi:hypothetical protein
MIIERKERDLAHKVLEKVGGYIKPDPRVASGDREACERLVPEYYVLRTALVSRIVLSLRTPADLPAGMAS